MPKQPAISRKRPSKKPLLNNAPQRVADKRDAIITQAYDVFYKSGFNAVTIDGLLAGTGISKRTFYKYFSNKDALVLAVLTHYRAGVFAALAKKISAKSDTKTDLKTAQKTVFTLFDHYFTAMKIGRHIGCLAVRAGLEHHGQNAAIVRFCAGFTKEVETLLFHVLPGASKSRKAQCAQQIMMIFNGALVYGQIHENADIGLKAKQLVKNVLQQTQ